MNKNNGLTDYKREKGKSKARNVHPERVTMKRKGDDLYVARSDEGRQALNGESATLEDFGF